MMEERTIRVVSTDDLPEYPLGIEDRLDSHYFMAWERRRWLNSDMRLKGTPECRALYFDLINIAYDQTPVGTVPQDLETLAKLLLVDPGHFRSLCKLDYGPLHKWTPCICEGGEVRLMHPMVLRSLTEALSRKEAREQARALLEQGADVKTAAPISIRLPIQSNSSQGAKPSSQMFPRQRSASRACPSLSSTALWEAAFISETEGKGVSVNPR